MVISKWKRVLLAVCLLLSGCLTHPEPSQEKRLLGIKNYACYYGKGRTEDLSKYDLVILQDYYSKDEIISIKKDKTIVLGYISLGEDYPLKEGDGTGPGGYASWYLDHFIGDGTRNPGKDNQPDKPEGWISYFVNTDDPAWQIYVLSKMDGLISKGYDGAFLDVVGHPLEYPEDLRREALRPGLIRLIKRLRKEYPGYYLVANRNDILKEIHNLIDGMMFESFSSYRVKWNEQDLAYTRGEAERINEIRGYPEDPGIVVLALDYVPKGDLDLIAFCYERARSFGFIPSVLSANLEIPDLCMVNPANRFEAEREEDGVLLTWQVSPEHLEESMLDHYIITRRSKPTGKEVSLGKIPGNTTSFKDLGAPAGVLYYTLMAINRGGMELVGRLKTQTSGD